MLGIISYIIYKMLKIKLPLSEIYHDGSNMAIENEIMAVF